MFLSNNKYSVYSIENLNYNGNDPTVRVNFNCDKYICKIYINTKKYIFIEQCSVYFITGK